MIDAAGLSCRSAHFSLGDLQASLNQKIDDALNLGAEWLVCSSPKPPKPLDPAKDWVAAMIEAMTLDGWKYNAEALAQMAPLVAKSGLRFAYHNHPMEFKDHSGVTGYDLLLQAVDPAQLRLEMDIGWVAAAGVDPVKAIQTYGSRVDLLHIKDIIKDPMAPIGYRSVEVGKGFIDWPAVLKAAHAAGVKGMFVEQEPPFLRPILTSLAMSRDYLTRL